MKTNKEVQQYIKNHIHLIDCNPGLFNNNLDLASRAKCFYFAKRNGRQIVRAKLIEELHELIDALESGYDVPSEKADVLIMLQQHTIIEDDAPDVQEAIAYKLERQTKRFTEEDQDGKYDI